MAKSSDDTETPRDDFLTKKLKPGGILAELVIVGPSGVEETLVQGGVAIYDPARELVPFFVAAAAAIHAGNAKPSLPVPWGDLKEGEDVPSADAPLKDRLKQAKEAPKDPFVKLMWDYWQELHLPAAYKHKFSFQEMTIGYRWHLWYNDDGSLDAAFQAFDVNHKVVESFDFDRRPIAEMPEALLATETVAKIMAQFGGGK